MVDPRIMDLEPEDDQSKPAGSVTIENPSVPVNVGSDMTVVDGVAEGDKLENFNKGE